MDSGLQTQSCKKLVLQVEPDLSKRDSSGPPQSSVEQAHDVLETVLSALPVTRERTGLLVEAEASHQQLLALLFHKKHKTVEYRV